MKKFVSIEQISAKHTFRCLLTTIFIVCTFYDSLWFLRYVEKVSLEIFIFFTRFFLYSYISFRGYIRCRWFQFQRTNFSTFSILYFIIFLNFMRSNFLLFPILYYLWHIFISIFLFNKFREFFQLFQVFIFVLRTEMLKAFVLSTASPPTTFMLLL